VEEEERGGKEVGGRLIFRVRARELGGRQPVPFPAGLPVEFTLSSLFDDALAALASLHSLMMP
jgi:hypothetical protein